jgi:hypothetical protein
MRFIPAVSPVQIQVPLPIFAGCQTASGDFFQPIFRRDGKQGNLKSQVNRKLLPGLFEKA